MLWKVKPHHNLLIERADLARNVFAQFMLGYGGMVSGQTDKAAERFKKVIELDLNAEEKQLLETSRGHVKEVMQVLDRLSN